MPHILSIPAHTRSNTHILKAKHNHQLPFLFHSVFQCHSSSGRYLEPTTNHLKAVNSNILVQKQIPLMHQHPTASPSEAKQPKAHPKPTTWHFNQRKNLSITFQSLSKILQASHYQQRTKEFVKQTHSAKHKKNPYAAHPYLCFVWHWGAEVG